MRGFERAARRAAGGARLLWVAGALAMTTTLAVAAPRDVDAASPPEERDWTFRVLLDGKEVGHHQFRVMRAGARERVEIDARIDVKVLFINAYRYRHRNVESWRDGCLVGIHASTNDNGERIEVAGRAAENGFVVARSGETRAIAGDCVQSFAYWNPAILESRRLLNSQTGEIVGVAIEALGSDSVRIGDRSVPARRYRISMDEGTIDLWYERDNGQWLALEAPTESGRVLRYEPVELPLALPDDERLVMD